MKNHSESKRQVIILLISLIVSVLTAIIPDWGKLEFSTADQLELAIGLFISFLLVDIIWVVSKFEKQQTRQYKLWEMRDPCDVILSNIRSAFQKITSQAYGEKDLFMCHFIKELTELEAKIREVSDNNSLRVQADHFLSVDNVLDAFHGDSEKVWRYTWEIDPEDKLFSDLHWRRYFEKTVEMVIAGQIKRIKSILIFKAMADLEIPRVGKLLDFFKTNKGLDCKLICSSDYRTIFADSRDPQPYEDFGIYGNRLLFLTEQYEPVIVGIFTKDHDRIQQFKSIFDNMWESRSITIMNPSIASTVVTLEELFAFDSQQN